MFQLWVSYKCSSLSLQAAIEFILTSSHLCPHVTLSERCSVMTLHKITPQSLSILHFIYLLTFQRQILDLFLYFWLPLSLQWKVSSIRTDFVFHWVPRAQHRVRGLDTEQAMLGVNKCRTQGTTFSIQAASTGEPDFTEFAWFFPSLYCPLSPSA